MANTPKYTFVEQSVAAPFFQGGLTALTGILQERNASEIHKKRLTGLADVLDAQGLHGDASIYRTIADNEQPDLLAAALAGKSKPRDLSMPFDHALDAIRAKANREATLEAAGIRSSGGSRIPLAQLRQEDEIDTSEQSAAQQDADAAEREEARINNQIIVAGASGDVEKVKLLEGQLTSVQERRRQAIERRDLSIENRRRRSSGVFSNIKDTSGGTAGGPANEVNLPFKSTDDLTVQPTAPDGSLLPQVESFKTSNEALIAGSKVADGLGGNNKVSTVRNDDGSFSFAINEPQDIIPSVRTNSVTEKPQDIERGIDKRFDESYVEKAKQEIPPDASQAFKRAKLYLAEQKDAAVKQFGPNESIDAATSPAQVKAIVSQLSKKKTYANESETPEAAVVKGREMIAEIGGSSNDLILSMRIGPGGGYIPILIKKSGLNRVNDSTWISADGSITYSADKDGFMHQTNNQTGESFLMKDPNNPNAAIPKSVFAGGVSLLQSDPTTAPASPTAVNPSDKAIKRGQIPTKKSVLDKFESLTPK